MVDYNPASINKLNKRYGGGYESEAYGGSKETFYNKGGFNKIQKSDLDDDTSSGYNQFKRKQTNQGLGSPTNNINNKDDDDDKDVGGVGAFFSRVFSWANESGLEFKKPDRPRPSVLYDRDDMKPIDFDAMDKRIDDAVNFDLANPLPSMNFKDDEYAASTYDEVQPLEGADTYKARRITAQGINDTIKGLMDTERRQQDIKQAVNKTIESLKSADDNVPYVIQAGDTLSDIAAKTGTTVQDLVKRNNIKDKNKIYTGNELIIPTDKTMKSKEDVVSSLVTGMDSGEYLKSISGKQESSSEGVEVADNRSLLDTLRNLLGLGGDEDIGGYDEIPDFIPKSKEEIKTTQQILSDAGYYSGKLAKIDGLKGKNYTNAIKTLQHNNGLKVTGEINTETARVIRGGDFVKNSEPKDPLLAFISSGEGGYGAANNGNSNRLKKKGKLFSVYDSYYSENNSKPLQEMTIKEILGAQIGKPNASMDQIKKHFKDQTDDRGKYTYTGKEMDDREFFAVGAYQIIPPTMMAAVNSMSLTGEEVYTPQLQDKIARDFLTADKRPALNSYLKGSDKVTVEQAMDDAAREWASLPNQQGLGMYDGQNATHTAAEAKKILENARAKYTVDNLGIAR